MMRDILFRAKAKHNPTLWVYGDYLSTLTKTGEKKHYIKRAEDGLLTPVEIIPETLGQYTGLTDKNETKVFEGDIVLFEDECPSNYEYHDCTEMRCGSIEYGDNCFYITGRIAVEMEDLIYDGKLDVEVIGNTTDSPELLGGVE